MSQATPTADGGRIAAELRHWARGCHSTEAAVELLIRARGGRFLDPGQPWLRTAGTRRVEGAFRWLRRLPGIGSLEVSATGRSASPHRSPAPWGCQRWPLTLRARAGSTSWSALSRSNGRITASASMPSHPATWTTSWPGVTVHEDPVTNERIARFTPLGRRASLEEIAAPFAFLASAGASYITGTVLAVDGRYTAN
jgi:hypothetical protein